MSEDKRKELSDYFDKKILNKQIMKYETKLKNLLRIAERD